MPLKLPVVDCACQMQIHRDAYAAAADEIVRGTQYINLCQFRKHIQHFLVPIQIDFQIDGQYNNNRFSMRLNEQ